MYWAWRWFRIKRRLRAARCFFIGHILDSDYAGEFCWRCHDYHPGDSLPELVRYRWRWFAYGVRSRAKRLIEWLSVCPYCGKRCCEIPNDDDHIPF